MRKSGQYNERFVLWKHEHTSDETGFQESKYRSVGKLWGSLDETNGTLQEAYGSTRAATDAVILIADFPEITSKDRLEDSFYQVWVIEGIARGKYEWIIDARRFEAGAP